MTRVRVICAEDCGNSPRKLLLKELNTAFVNGVVDSVLEHVRDDIVWEVIGDKSFDGKRAVHLHLQQLANRPITELHIENIITHGNTAAVNGLITVADGRQWAFCDVYVFGGFGRNAKIKKITSFCIEVDPS